ncbi:MAG: antibiotic biosynthesis monooxygenase [Pseudonocardia sp.]|nr:antibiotic biosynthesis monooxygenase [Pseudonocardia sp.]
MSIPTDDDRTLLTVVATARAKPGKEQEMRDLLTSFVAPTRAEKGSVVYALHQGAADPAAFALYEVWESQADLDAHLASPGLQAGLGQLAELVDGEVTITPLDRIA